MPKIIPFFVFIGLLVFGFFIYSNRTITDSQSFVVENNYETNIKLQSGNVYVRPSEGDLASNLKYSKNKPDLSVISNFLNLQGGKIVESTLYLPKEKNLSDLEISLGSGNIDLSLVDIPVKKISINTQASNVKLSVPGEVSSEINLTITAGNIQLQIPKNNKLDGVRIVPQPGTTLNLSESGWKKVGSNYETANFSKSTVRSIIYLSVGAANLEITTIP